MGYKIDEEVRKQVLKDIYALPGYRKLYDEYRNLRLQGKFAQSMIVAKKMKVMENSVFAELYKTYADKNAYTDEVLRNMSEEDKTTMNVLANALYLMSDTIDSMTTESHGILKKYGIDEDSRFDKLTKMLKEVKSAVFVFDSLLADDYACKLAGNMSDNMYKLVYNKASSFSKKLRDYAEKADKKAARNAKMA